MAIQAQIYPEVSGFPMYITPEWAGDGGGVNGIHDDDALLNLQRQQLLVSGKVPPFHSQNQYPKNAPFLKQNETTSCPYTQRLCSLIEKQSVEIDNFIVAQNERLRHGFWVQRKRDVTELLKKIETRTRFLLTQKDEEITRATTRNSQLESLLVNLQTDCLTWQQIAKQNELHVISLNNTIQLLQQQQQPNVSVIEDTESCCEELELQSGLGKGKMVCRVCERREVRVVVLPCRHLCLCGVCDQMIDLCPVCRTVKEGSVVALFC